MVVLAVLTAADVEELSATLPKTGKSEANLYPVIVSGRDVNAMMTDGFAARRNLSDNITFISIEIVSQSNRFRTFDDLHLIIYDGMLIDIRIGIETLCPEPADVGTATVKDDSHSLEVVSQLQEVSFMA